jgi:membrane fusion protein (multidrug efflux system)
MFGGSRPVKASCEKRAPRRPPARRLGFGAALGIGILTSLLGCQKKNQYVEPPPPEVIVSSPRQQDVTEFIETRGTTHAVQTVEIRARVRGFLKERHVQDGEIVAPGQLLLVIDEEPFQVALDQAKAGLAEAEAALAKATQSQAREMMRAQLALDESQLRLAITEEQRMRPLAAVGSGAVSQEDMDRAIANRKQMEAKIAATRANLAQVEADYNTNIDTAKAKVAAAKTAVRSAEIDLGYCRMTSPIAGRIGRVNYDVGNLVGDMQASLLTTIVNNDPIQMYVSLSVADFIKYRNVAGEPLPGSHPEEQIPVELRLEGESDYRHRGRIDYHDPIVDQGTGTIQVRAVFPNGDGLILPGMSGGMRIPVGHQSAALLVPDSAIGTDQLGQYVYVVDSDNKVVYRQVHTGQAIGGMRVVEGKIGPQDRVIVEGLLRARPGVKVAPKAEVAQATLRDEDIVSGAPGESAASRTSTANSK